MTKICVGGPKCFIIGVLLVSSVFGEKDNMISQGTVATCVGVVGSLMSAVLEICC